MNRTAIDWREGIFWDVDVSFYFLWGNIESSEGEKNETKQTSLPRNQSSVDCFANRTTTQH